MQSELLRDIKVCEPDELYKKYKICVNQDGTVYDRTKNILFENLLEWSNYRLDFSAKAANMSA